MAVSMQTPIPTYGNFGTTIADSINKKAGRVHDAEMQQNKINSVEGMHADSLEQQATEHRIDSAIRTGIALDDFSGLGLEEYYGPSYVDAANLNLKENNGDPIKTYNDLTNGSSNNSNNLNFGRTLNRENFDITVDKGEEHALISNAIAGTEIDIENRAHEREVWMNDMRDDTGYAERFFAGLGWRIMNPTEGWFDGKTHYQSFLDEIYDEALHRDDKTILYDEFHERGLDPQNLKYPENAVYNVQTQNNTINPESQQDILKMFEQYGVGFNSNGGPGGGNNLNQDQLMNLFDLLDTGK